MGSEESHSVDEKTTRLINEMEKSLHNTENSLGMDHPLVSKILDSYAALLRQKNMRHLDALNMEARAKAIRARHLQKEAEKQAIGLETSHEPTNRISMGKLRGLVWLISIFILIIFGFVGIDVINKSTGEAMKMRLATLRQRNNNPGTEFAGPERAYNIAPNSPESIKASIEAANRAAENAAAREANNTALRAAREAYFRADRDADNKAAREAAINAAVSAARDEAIKAARAAAAKNGGLIYLVEKPGNGGPEIYRDNAGKDGPPRVVSTETRQVTDPYTGQITPIAVTTTQSQSSMIETAEKSQKIKNLAKEALSIGMAAEQEKDYRRATEAYENVVRETQSAPSQIGSPVFSEEIAQCYEGYARMSDLASHPEIAKEWRQAARDVRSHLLD